MSAASSKEDIKEKKPAALPRVFYKIYFAT